MAYRGAFQHTLREAMREEVERSTRRRVIAAMGCAHHDPDLMVELFVFETSSRRLARVRGAQEQSETMMRAAREVS